MLTYSYSPSLSQFPLKRIFFGKVVFKIWPESKLREIKIELKFLKRYNILEFFVPICDFFITRTYMVQISLQNSGGKVVFSENPPWAPIGVFFIYFITSSLAWGYPISDNTVFHGCPGSNKIHQKAKTLHIKYTNSKGYMNIN